MKKIAFLILLVFSASISEGGFGDFLKDVVKKEDKEKPKGEENSPPPEGENKGLVQGIGGVLGLKEKEIKQINQGLKVVQALQPIKKEEEIAIGGAIAVEAFARFGGEYNNEAALKYLNLVGKTIAEISDRPELDFHFAILNSEEENAFAAPGGYVFVTKGLLKGLKNEAELAGVLAHEIAHITKKHMLNTLQRSKMLSNLSELTLSAMDKDPKLFSDIMNEMTDMLFNKGLDKNLEFEADQVGLEYSYRAGYNPSGLRDFLITLKNHEGKGESRFYSTHPSTSQRVESASNLLKNYAGLEKMALLEKRFLSVKKTI